MSNGGCVSHLGGRSSSLQCCVFTFDPSLMEPCNQNRQSVIPSCLCQQKKNIERAKHSGESKGLHRRSCETRVRQILQIAAALHEEIHMATDACDCCQVRDAMGGVSRVQERKIPEGGARVSCLCKPVLDFHVTSLPLKGLAV